MAYLPLRRRYANPAGSVAERGVDRARLHGVVVLRAGGRAGRFRVSDVVRLCGHGPAGEPGKDLRAASSSRAFELQHQKRRSFAQAESGAFDIERTAGPEISGIQRVETGERQGAKTVGTPNDDARDGSPEEPSRAVDDGIRATGAGAAERDRAIDPAQRLGDVLGGGRERIRKQPSCGRLRRFPSLHRAKNGFGLVHAAGRRADG
jgi:hypothetical protein